MKIYILTDESFPNGMAATNRIKNYARALGSVNADVEILIFKRTEVRGQKTKNTEGTGRMEGIPYAYISGTPLSGSNILVRLFNIWMDRRKTIAYLKKKLMPTDIVFGYVGRHVDFMLEVIKTTHRKKAKFVRELCEIPFYGNTSLKAKRGYQKSTEVLFPQCDGFIAISEGLVGLANKFKSPQCKVLKVPTIVDSRFFNIEDTSHEQTVPYIFHAGTFTEQKDGILGIIEAFARAVPRINKPVKYVMAGNVENSPHKRQIDELIQKHHLQDTIDFVGYLDTEQVQKYLAGSSLVILNKYKTIQNYYGFSNKLSEYLAAGKAVITTHWGEAPLWLKDGESAYIVEPENVDALSDAIVRAMNNDGEREKIAQAGKDVCRRHFDYHVYGEKMLDFFKQL